MSDTDTSVDTDALDSCDALAASLGHENYWCWDPKEGDYSQILLLLGIVYSIFLGSILLTYAAYINNTMSITAIKLPISSSRIPIPKIIATNYKNTENVNIILHIINIIGHIIFFIIKLGILSNTKDFTGVNEDFQSMDFQQFMSTHRILLIYLLLLSTWLFWWNHITFTALTGTLGDDIGGGSADKIVITFGYILLVTDAVFTILIICIYYSLLVIILYLSVIALIGILMGLIVSICFIIIFGICVTKLCVDCCVIIRRDDLDDIYIEFTNPIIQFMIMNLNIIFIAVILFSINYWEYWCGWYFLGGPPDSFFYVDFNEHASTARYWLFILSATFGASAVIGTWFSVCYLCSNEQEMTRGSHVQIVNQFDD